MIPLLILAGCGPGYRGTETRGSVGGIARVRSVAAETRDAFEASAARARNDLDAAAAAAEAAVEARAARSEMTSRRARERARQALRKGAEVLREAARDGGEAAVGWARLIQDRMMRLEEVLDTLARRGPDHDDS